MKSRIFAPALVLFLTALPAFAAGSARCYSFTTTEVPEREARPSPRTERWCYQDIQTAGGGAFIYNADSAVVRPELALVRHANGILTHGSLQAGKVTMHSVRFAQFNPFPVPLDEPRHLAASAAPQSRAFTESADAVLAALLRAENPNPATLAVSPGVTAAQASALPWRGFWWPMKGQPMIGPLSKYDAFVGARDRNPGAAAWESSHHVSHGIWWEGHCNGWAAAAIMRAEPSSPRIDSNSGQSFRVSDLKGVLTEEDYCANAAMFGHRWRRSGDVLVTPEEFHKALTYHVGQLHKLIAFNERADGVVDNRVISSYDMSVANSGPGEVTVTTSVRLHTYDGQRVESPGVAPSYTRVYKYTLQQSPDGAVSGGRWLSAMPGFVWVPLSPGKCSAGDPYLSESYIGSLTQ